MGFFLMIWALSALGFLGLAAAMDKHQKQFFAKVLPPKQSLMAKTSGWSLLILTLIISISHYGIADGISYWVGVLSFAAAFVLLSLSYLQQHFKLLSIGLAVTTVLGIMLIML